ncbi:MAG: hypothetical protein QM638_01195 [Nocardioides sp.]|uniref:hypothetical protein n=1 Tax=Nocardioides sp. TaxID=35761 RepID=UPI0039E5C997
MSARLAKRQLVEPDYWTCPHGVRVRPEPALTYGPEVADVCAQAGFPPDPQQELGLDLVFAIRSDGAPASFAFCVVCARQNLKSGLFLQSSIGWLFVTEVPEIAWSAHELKTSLDAQDELFEILSSSSLSRYLPATQNGGKYDTNGKERQELNTGQTVWFQTRTRDGGRGLKKPKVIIDEAFKFKKRTADALLPILLAQYHPQVLYGSSAPPLDPDAEALRDLIDRGRNHKSPELSYLEWLARREPCADPECTHPKDALDRGIDCALDRQHLLLQANPTVHRDAEGNPLDTGRITIRTLRNLRQELSPEGYMRECLGWEDLPTDAGGPPAINATRWASKELRDPKAPAPKRACVVLYTEPDRSVTSIGVAGRNSAGDLVILEHTEPAGSGEAWVIDRLKRVRANIEVLEVALHPSTEAKTLIPALNAAEIEWHKLVHNDLSGGCSALLTKIAGGEVTHLGQTALDTAVTVARTRQVGRQGRYFDSRNTPIPISPLVATSTALYRFELAEAEKAKTSPPSPESIPDSSAESITNSNTSNNLDGNSAIDWDTVAF